MAENSIANCHWQACDECKHGLDEGGCGVEEDNDYELDPNSDTIVCVEFTASTS